MGIFNKLAGLVSKKEKSEEEKLLIVVLADLNRAQNYISFRFWFTLKDVDSDFLLAYHLRRFQRKLHKAISLLKGAINYLGNIKEIIESKEASGDYRRAAFTQKDKLLLDLVKKESKSISSLVSYLQEWLEDLESKRKSKHLFMTPGFAGWLFKQRDITKAKIELIDRSIKDILGFLASQK